MIPLSPHEIAVYYRAKAPDIPQAKGHKQWRGPCPLHGGERDSFSINAETGQWSCFSDCNAGGDVFDFERRLTSADFKTARREVYRIVGRPEERTNGHQRRASKRRTIEKSYDYEDESGNLLFQAVRFRPKGFSQRQPDGKGGWTWNLDGVRLVPYRLPQLIAAEKVLVVEGEKDVHSVERLSFTATCNPMGAGKWRDSYSDLLVGKTVAILPDNDEPGEKHAQQIAASLHGKAKAVRIVNVPTGKDISDWIAAGATADDIKAAITAAEDWEPEPGSEASPAASNAPPLLQYPLTDSGNAERLIALHGDEIRYCVEMRKWLVWDGRRWAVDDMERIRQLVVRTSRALYTESAGIDDTVFREAVEKHALKSENAQAVTNTLAQAKLPGVCVRASELDSSRWLLNVRNGTIDLKTGELREHRPGDLITKLAPVDFDPDATCDRFLSFIREILDGREDLMEYVQRAFGYALTGIVSEKALFAFFGSGNNGKTTLLEIVRYIVGEYGSQVLIDTLMTKRHETSNASLADLADLRDARLVTTSEVEEGQRLAEGKVKYLTGMGEIKTCRKYENHISFQPTHTIFMDANHRPGVRGTDKAIWARLKPIPFTVAIPEEKQDKALMEKLKAEAPGILSWLVYGCLDWQKEGLGDPPEIQDEVAEWKTECDPLADFLDDCCVLTPAAATPSTKLWAAYLKWGEEQGEKHLIGRKKFADRLLVLGCEPDRNNALGRYWKGIGLRAEVPA